MGSMGMTFGGTPVARVPGGRRIALACLASSLIACQEPRPMAGSDGGPDTAFADGRVVEAPALPVAAGAAGLILWSFNLRYANLSDAGNLWTGRRDQVYSMLRAASPDVVGLQEALHSQVLDLKSALPAYAAVGVGRKDGRASGEFSPLFYRADRFRADTSGTFWFSDTPEAPGSRSWGNAVARICTWARLVERNTGRGLYIFNVHLDHESRPSRERSALLLMDRIRQARHPADPVFVTGDFNVGEDDPVILYLKGKASLLGKANAVPFRDSFRMVDSASTAVATWHGFKGTVTGAKIDYVFVLPRIRVQSAAIVRMRENGEYPSDHFPVSAALIVPEWSDGSDRRL